LIILNISGFVFDEIIYLTAPQIAFDKLSSRRVSYKKTILDDEFVVRQGLKGLFEEILSNDKICYDLEAEFVFCKKEVSQKNSNYLSKMFGETFSIIPLNNK
jgi:hypothetical protein